MSNLIQSIIDNGEQVDLRAFANKLRRQENRYLLRNDIQTAFEEYCNQQEKPEDFRQQSALGQLIHYTQEIILEGEDLNLIIRPQIVTRETFRLHMETLTFEPVTDRELLALRDRLTDHYHPNEGRLLELDFGPFYDYSPQIRDPKNIGKGGQFLSRYLSSQLFQSPQEWLESLFNFLRLHKIDNQQLLINERIRTRQQLSERIKQALSFLGGRPAEQPFSEFKFDLQNLGFEPGWGNTVRRVQETLEILDHLIDSPDHQALEEFISRIPMIFKIVLVSPHGWFGQENVLGRPDTGGQVVYVLDQAKSLEQQLQEDIHLAGLDYKPKVIILTRLIPNNDGTRSNERLEKVHATDNAWILRVPFREFNPRYSQSWMSRFEIWPYLETFAIDAERELLSEFLGVPDLIVGNYSDGNLVAFLLARSLGVTQCNIAHALEKSKYLFSNLYWQESEDNYHFSLQFTADLIAMNAANFIISSTYQEIVGTTESTGQYESYDCFTMPDLYHVLDGIDLFNPKFNVVPPGVNENFYFPHTATERRLPSETERLEQLLFSETDPLHVLGSLKEPQKRPLFTMARLDRIKNITGLVECFGRCPELQEHCNLIVIAGKLRTEDSQDYEEADEIQKMYHLIDQYDLHGKIRWLGVRLSKDDSGEIYRIIADRQGIFVQPALFEAFGLTILEAMISGLPVFGTCFGGPLEIIQDKVNGFYINPTHVEEMGQLMLDFVSKLDHYPEQWQEISKRAIERVYSSYTWKIHTSRLLRLAKTYGFWNYSSQENREDLLRYLESLFYLLYKPRAKALLDKHMQAG
ncbi:sucrose synthase [Leptolyngbya sp. FACHB-261]|uniref:sucrose synthase n=1 Tax=Leptolyngbya sp. FACHB-261 TaxID=2692806 RepID=UPI0016898DE8|nr:sucrose synthase [Leptolyngbya sp. FACHB-261]MBD2104137.1 sucrose synthase [Leptolyngbya sp. FACHB-261]